MAEPTTPKRTARPPINRSQTADASISPPSRRSHATTTNAQHPSLHSHSNSRKLPINFGELLHHHIHSNPNHDKEEKERPGGMAGNRRSFVNAAARSRPVSAVMNDLSRITSRLPAGGSGDGSARHSLLIPGANSGSGSGSGSGSLDIRAGAITSTAAELEKTNAPARLPLKIPRGPIRPEALQAERARGAVREQELRTALDALSSLAHNGTRKLDNTYYSILEKAALLRSSVTRLQELCAASTTLHEHFQADAAEVQEEIESQIESFGGFVAEKARIDELEGRIKAGRLRAEQLSARLETARGEVEALDKREIKWQTTTAKRIRLCWACFAAFCLVVLVLTLLKKRYDGGGGASTGVEGVGGIVGVGKSLLHKRADDLNETEMNAVLPDFIVKDLLEASASSLQSASSISLHRQRASAPTLTRDLRLDKFDEL